jgi:hypothetical protein
MYCINKAETKEERKRKESKKETWEKEDLPESQSVKCKEG